MQGIRKQTKEELAANAARVAQRFDAAKRGEYTSFQDAMQALKEQGKD